MKMLSKKILIGVLAGAFLLAGVAVPFAATQAMQGNPPGQGQGMQRPPRLSPNDRAQAIADQFGVKQADVIKYFDQGTDFRDLGQASFLAKASGKSLSQVMAAKTTDNTWRDVATSLGVTPEIAKATRQDIAATQLEKKINIKKSVALDLLQQGYHSRDIAFAGVLANQTGKPIADVLALKKINNSWHDVAQALGVNDEAFKQDMTQVRQAAPGPHFAGHAGGWGHHAGPDQLPF